MEAHGLKFDLDILDYLTHSAIQDLFTAEKASDEVLFERVQASLQIVYAFQILFTTKYPHAEVPSIIRFRLQLLQQTLYWTSYTEELLQSDVDHLQRQRAEYRSRASRFLSTNCTSNKFECRPTECNSLPNPPHRTLLDAVSDLMRISADYFHISDKTIGPKWIQLMVDVMSAAAIDQYINFGVRVQVALSIAFAYGFSIEFVEDGTNGGELAMASLFWDPITEKENMHWTVARASALDQVCRLGCRYLATYSKLTR